MSFTISGSCPVAVIVAVNSKPMASQDEWWFIVISCFILKGFDFCKVGTAKRLAADELPLSLPTIPTINRHPFRSGLWVLSYFGAVPAVMRPDSTGL